MEQLSNIQKQRKVYTEKNMWLVAFLGGPLSAGYIIAENFKTFIKSPNGNYLFYTRDGGNVEFPLPKALLGKKLKFTTLTKKGPGKEIPHVIADGVFKVKTAPHTPYKVSVL